MQEVYEIFWSEKKLKLSDKCNKHKKCFIFLLDVVE